MNIPNLAIHLDRTVNESGFKPNFENNLKPILATAAKALGAKDGESHHPALLDEIAKEAGCARACSLNTQHNIHTPPNPRRPLALCSSGPETTLMHRA